MVIGGSFAFFKADRACGAGGQAVAQAVAVILAQQPRLAIYHADGPLMAGGGTQAAAQAFQPEVCAHPQDLPFLASAGMGLF